MPIDPRLPLLVQQPQIESPLESQARRLSLQGTALEQAQKIKGIQDQERIQQVISEHLAQGGDPNDLRPVASKVMAINPQVGMQLWRQVAAEQQKAALAKLEEARAKKESQVATTQHLNEVIGRMSPILDVPEADQPAAYKAWREDMVRQGTLDANDTTIPAEFDKGYVTRAVAGLRALQKQSPGGVHFKENVVHPETGETGLGIFSNSGQLINFLKGGTTGAHIAPELGGQVVGADNQSIPGTLTFDRASGTYKLNGQDLPVGARVEKALPPEKPADQNKLEQQYRQTIVRAKLSSQSPLGVEARKVDSAIHLGQLFDQSYDPKTGRYEIPSSMEKDLLMGMATLLSPTGRPGIEMLVELQQPTLEGRLRGLWTQITGKPITGNTQDVLKMYKAVVDRQGATSEQLRDQMMDEIYALAPTELEESRRRALETHNFPSFINRKGASPTEISPTKRSSGATTPSSGSGLFVGADGQLHKGSPTGPIQ